MKRIFAFLSALFVCCSPCFAWTSESFLGNDYSHSDIDDYDLYPLDAVTFSSPRLMSSRSSSSALYRVDFMSPSLVEWIDPSNPYAYLVGSYYLTYPVSVDLFGIFGEVDLPSSPPMPVESGSNYRFGGDVYSLDYDFDMGSSSYLTSWDYVQTNGIMAFYDIPVPSDSYGVSFSPYIRVFSQARISGVYTDYLPAIVKFFVDGEEVYSFSTTTNYFTSESSFTFTEPIQSVQVCVIFPHTQVTVGLPADSSESGSITAWYRGYIRSDSFLDIGFLSEFGVLNSHNDQAQNDINDHNAIESEWTGSMTANFDALSISDFEYPSGLISGFGLISGIFNDLWNGMGEYKIVYVFPLTLGVVLVVIGRMGRTKGGQGSGITNRGDSDA